MFDLQHDAQMDYYGKRLATASSDRTVRIFDVVDGHYQPIATLQGYGTFILA
jgi:protein transport protein SEC13